MFRFLESRYSKEEKELLKFLRNILGCKPKNISLYKLSLVHKSCTQKDAKGHKFNNERLEYLGDAVLSAIVGEFLFKKYPHKGEGFLTEMRSKMVSRANLNRLSIKIGLSNLIEYTKERAGEGHFASVDGDAFEALVGALYLDKGYACTYRILTKKLFSTYMDIDGLENTDWNYKGKLIAWGQKHKHNVSFETLEVIELNHRKQYNVQVKVSDVPIATAIDYSIKSAEQLAAEKSYKKIIKEGVSILEAPKTITENE